MFVGQISSVVFNEKITFFDCNSLREILFCQHLLYLLVDDYLPSFSQITIHLCDYRIDPTVDVYYYYFSPSKCQSDFELRSRLSYLKSVSVKLLLYFINVLNIESKKLERRKLEKSKIHFY